MSVAIHFGFIQEVTIETKLGINRSVLEIGLQMPTSIGQFLYVWSSGLASASVDHCRLLESGSDPEAIGGSDMYRDLVLAGFVMNYEGLPTSIAFDDRTLVVLNCFGADRFQLESLPYFCTTMIKRVSDSKKNPHFELAFMFNLNMAAVIMLSDTDLMPTNLAAAK